MQSHDCSEADSGHVGYRALPEPEWAIQAHHQLALPNQRPLNLDAFGYLHPVDPSHVYYPEYSQQRFDPVHPSDQGHHREVYDNGAHYEEPHKHGYDQHHEHPHEQFYAHSYDQSYGNGSSPPKDELAVSFLSAPLGSATEVGPDQILDHNAVVADHEGQYAYLPEPEHRMHHSHFTHVHAGEALPSSPLNLDAIPPIYQPYREAPIYSPSASSFSNSSFSDTSNTRSASSAANSEYGFDTEEAASAHSSSIGPIRTCQSPASHRNSPYPSRRASCSSNTSLNRGLRDKLATLDVASQAQAGGSLATPATGNLPYLDSAPSGTSTITGIYDSTLRVPQPHYGYQVQSVASPGFYEPPQQHFQTLDPRSTPAEESFPRQENQYSYGASSWVPYQLTDDEDERPTRHSRDTTVRASQFPTTAPLPKASDGIPDSEFYVTPQGTIPGARTVINGLNPSTSGAFRDDYDAEMLATLNTRAPRGRKALVPASVGLPDGVDPNREPTEAIVDFVGTTKGGRLKKVYQCKVPGCGNFFKRAEHLKRHVRSIHTNEKPFVCPYERCGKTFTRVDNMNQHIRVHEKRVEAGEDPVPPPEPRKSRTKPKPKKAVKKNKDDDEFVPGFDTLS